MNHWFDKDVKMKDLVEKKYSLEANCICCDKEYLKKHPFQKYCSHECKKKVNLERVRKKNSKIIRKIYTLNCPQCDVEFKTNHSSKKYCSDQCRHDFNVIGINLDKRDCKYCGSIFQPINTTQKFCSTKCTYKKRMSTNLWLKLRFNVFKRDKFTCQYCGRNSYIDGVKLHVDHIFPKSKGGEDSMNNLITSCIECNLGKYDVILNKRIMEKLKNSIIRRVEQREEDRKNKEKFQEAEVSI